MSTTRIPGCAMLYDGWLYSVKNKRVNYTIETVNSDFTLNWKVFSTQTNAVPGLVTESL